MIFSILGSNPSLLHCWKILYHLSHQERLKIKNKEKSIHDIRKGLVNSRLLVVKLWEIKSWSGTSDCPGWGGELAPQSSYRSRVTCISFTPVIQYLLNERETACFKHLCSTVTEWKERNSRKIPNSSRFKKFPLLLAEGRFKSRDKVNKPPSYPLIFFRGSLINKMRHWLEVKCVVSTHVILQKAEHRSPHFPPLQNRK